MKIPFKTSRVDGDELVMDVIVPVKQIIFNIRSREISIVCDEVVEVQETKVSAAEVDMSYSDLSWQAIKALVEENNGTWTNKKEGIEYLEGLTA